MIDKKTIKRLEYNKVLDQLSSHAGSALGKERALNLQPVYDLDVILKRQEETSEGRDLIRLEPSAGFGGWKDIRSQLQRAGRGAVLEPEELDSVGATLTAGRIIKNFLHERRERYRLLGELALPLVSLPELEQQIKKAILPGGEIADGASHELSQIRRRLTGAQAHIKSYLEQIIRSPNYQKYLQDPIVTLREGRYVVPVKIEFRSHVPGIVHDQSASGATLFVEPMAVVEQNNELRRLLVAEKQEILKILTGLSAKVAQNAEALEYSLDALGELDFIIAKARYSQALDAWAPAVEGNAVMNIRQGRHPLLKGNVVPVTIRLGEDFDILVITGPNTGGKTVALKTAGLLVLMAQSGLHIPVGEGTVLGVFKQVFADIGDEQSIEQSLSSFSSHMNNIVDIIAHAGRDSLVLLDELGAGTDPAEGAALAQSILEKLHSAGAKTVATTHYSELKSFAYSRDRVENASVEFNAVTLMPTFRLLIGKPGRSNAFEIALRLGLPGDIVNRARDFLTVEQVRAEELMSNLEKTQQEAETDSKKASQMAAEAVTLKEKYEKMLNNLIQKREAILARAGEEARILVKTTKLEAETAVKELREKIAADAARDREGAVREVRERLNSLQHKVARRVPEKTAAGEAPGDLRPGEEVFLPKFNQRAYVLAPPGSGDEVQVQVGIIKMSVSLKDLRKVKNTGQAGGGQSEVSGMLLGKAREISSELDLRGQYAEEALLQVEKYLDDAYLAGLSRVCLIHGKGTGVLRSVIHKQLQGNQRVKSFRLGEQGEGGYGVTMVELAN